MRATFQVTRRYPVIVNSNSAPSTIPALFRHAIILVPILFLCGCGGDGSNTGAASGVSGSGSGGSGSGGSSGSGSGNTGSGGSGSSGSGSGTPNAYSVGGTVVGLNGSGLLLTNNDGDVLSVGAGTTFTFPPTVNSGDSYQVAILEQPTNPAQTCSLTAATGVVTNANITAPAVTCVNLYPRFAYVVNSGDNTVSIYSIAPTTGRLRSRGYVMTGASPTAVTLDPSGRFAYVANTVDGTISAFSVDPNAGALSVIPG